MAPVLTLALRADLIQPAFDERPSLLAEPALGAGSRYVRLMHCQPMINVADVEQSSSWYQQLLGAQSGHGGSDFEMLMSDNELMLMLHSAAGAEHHPMGDQEGPAGKGVVLYFRVGKGFGEAVERAKAMSANIVRGPEFNELAHQDELWVRDPDGYTLVLCGPADWG